MGISDLAQSIASGAKIKNGSWRGALATTIAGGIGFAIVQGVQTVILAPGRALEDSVDMVGGALAGGVDQFISTATELWSKAWTTGVDLGLVQFPYAVLIVLGTFLVVANIARIWRDG